VPQDHAPRAVVASQSMVSTGAAGAKLGFGTKWWFGVGQASEGIMNAAYLVFLLLFYNQVLGLNPALGGAALMLSLVFDAVTDPIVGSVSDGWHGKWGRRHPFMYVSALPLGLTFWLSFAPPAGLGQWGLFAWLLTSVVLARLAMTLYHVPHLALGAELTDDYSERSIVVAYRIFFGYGGALLLFVICSRVLMLPTAAHPVGQLNPAAYPRLGAWFGVAMAVLILASALGTHARIPHLPAPSTAPASFSLRRIAAEIGVGMRNRSFRTLFVGLLFFYVSRGIESGLGLYMGTYFWRLGTQAVVVPIAGIFGVMVGTVAWALVAGRLEKKSMFMFGFIGFCTVSTLLPILKLLEWFPDPSSPWYTRLIYLGTVFGSLLAGAPLVAGGSMLADVADEHDLETGTRQEGIFFGALSFSGKAAAGLGNGLSGLLLWLIAFPNKADPATLDPGIVRWLGLCYGPGCAILIVVSVIVLTRYDLSRARHATIQSALLERRARSTRGEAAQ
jgi:GPH family glycoside/pentoside/hexuronide:cation symporter